MLKKVLLFFGFILLLSLSTFATKRALIIAIGEYEWGTGWPYLSSENDISLIKNALLSQNFSENEIDIIRDEAATKEGILAALMNLYNKAKPGDIIVVHYSGHGQQVEDFSGDEADGLDEALVPYNAKATYSDNPLYSGQNHIIDDEIEMILNNFRNKLGKDGQLLFILDSCHSGSASRGNTGEIKTRGGQPALVGPGWKAPAGSSRSKGSDYYENAAETGSAAGIETLTKYFKLTRLDDGAAPFIMISGASANELNYEYNGHGSLSYAFSKAMAELGSGFTYRQLFANIAAIMNGIAPRQKPVIEGDIDAKLFRNEYVKQTPYYDVTDISSGNKVLTINGGQVNSIFDNATMLVMPMGSRQADEGQAISKGSVTNAGFAEAVIELDKPLDDDNVKKYWVFIDQPTYGDIAIKVFIDSSVREETITSGIADFLKKNSLGDVVDSINSSDVIIDYANGNYLVSATKGENQVGKLAKSRGDALKTIENQLFNFAQGNYLKNLNLNSEGYEFSFELIPVEYNPATKTVIHVLDPVKNDANGTFEVRPKQDYVVLKINNESDRDLFFSIVEINSNGEISPFFPNSKCNLSNSERQLAAHSSHTYEGCVYSFAPPYERLILKGFASDKPLNLSSVASRGPVQNNNPLEQFLKNTYVQSRGSDSEETGSGVVGGSAQFLYEIVK